MRAPLQRLSALREHALSSPMRAPAASLLVVVAAAHVTVVEDHLQAAPYIGVLFALLIAASFVLAVLIVCCDTPMIWAASAITCAAAVVAFAISRSVGLPQIQDDVGRWTEPVALAAITAEVLLVGVAVCVLARPTLTTRLSSTWRIGAVVLVGGLVWVATGAAKTSTTASSQHSMAGMTMAGTGYWSKVSGAAFHSEGTTRTYYIEADEVVWNYAPAGRNEVTGRPFDDVADTYVATGRGRIGSKYLKCLYVGYTDATFAHRIDRAGTQDSYLGLLGPTIRAVVGDTLKVVYRNRCSIPTSVHPHGVFYKKNSEGAPYSDGTSGADKADDGVPTGGQHTYTWQVPERAGPGPNDGSSVMWMYHSHADEIGDTYAGLMGAMIVTRAGMARPDGSPADVDREVFELFSVMNENQSPYLDGNVKRFAASPPEPNDEGFEESNLMHSINGYVFGNQPLVTLHTGEHVRWYVMSMGTEVDLHTPHWHGNTVTTNGMRMDVVNLLPASMVVADMVPDNPGTWLFHCHVNDHLRAGMMTRYRVTDG